MAIYDFTRGDICWSNTPYTQAARQELPYIEMVGWQQTWSSASASVKRWLKRASSAASGNGGSLNSPYDGLYLGTEVSTYKLPYFEEYHHGTTQNWEQNSAPLGPIVAEMTDLVESVAKAIVPAAGIIYPKSYAGSSENTYSFTFNLINTNAGGGNDISTNIRKNKGFIESFVSDNLHDMNNSLTVSPPLIYEVFIPGIRWSPAAVVSGFTINNKGTMNRNINGMIAGATADYIYPDAWEVTVQISELINESRLLWSDAIAGKGSSGLTTRVFGSRA